MDNKEMLFQFFAGYFHQDFLLEYVSPDAAIETYKQESNSDERVLLSKAILDYIDQHPDDADLDNKLSSELGCYYHTQADSMTARVWMQKVAQQLVS